MKDRLACAIIEATWKLCRDRSTRTAGGSWVVAEAVALCAGWPHSHVAKPHRLVDSACCSSGSSPLPLLPLRACRDKDTKNVSQDSYWHSFTLLPSVRSPNTRYAMRMAGSRRWGGQHAVGSSGPLSLGLSFFVRSMSTLLLVQFCHIPLLCLHQWRRCVWLGSK